MAICSSTWASAFFRVFAVASRPGFAIALLRTSSTFCRAFSTSMAVSAAWCDSWMDGLSNRAEAWNEGQWNCCREEGLQLWGHNCSSLERQFDVGVLQDGTVVPAGHQGFVGEAYFGSNPLLFAGLAKDCFQIVTNVNSMAIKGAFFESSEGMGSVVLFHCACTRSRISGGSAG
jgi:hypothetical protein